MFKKAVIFDMDGVVSDTQKFHAEVESLILADYNISLEPNAITRRYAGVADDEMFREIFTENGLPVPSLDEIVFEKWHRMGAVADGKITPIPHAIELIKALKQADFGLAIASASTLDFIGQVLDELDLHVYFDTLVSAQEVERGKPDPGVFLLAAERLNVAAERCLVIEDGRSGMVGAHAAGMKAIGLVEDTAGDYPADLLVNSLDEVNPAAIDMLIGQ